MRVYYKQVQLNPTQETDYTDLANKPAINGVELEGDLSTEQIKITWHGTQAEFDALPSVDPYTFYIIDDGIPVGMQESYLNLSDKPSINGQVLTGNKVSSDLNMYTSDEVDNIIASMRAIKVVTALPAAPAVNTMYYVGPDSEGVYQVYLFDSLLNRIDLGPSVQKLYTAGNAIGINETTSTISVKYDGTSIRTNTSNELYVPELMGSEGSGVNPIYLDSGELKASTSTVGSDNIPVYLKNGVITSAGHLYAGNWTGNAVAYHNGSTLEIGPNIDFHDSTSTTDYDVRLGYNSAAPSGLQIYKSGNGGYVPTTSSNAGVGSKIQPVYVDNGILTEVNTLSSGAWSNSTGAVPQVVGSVLEIGQHIDFHLPTSTKDFNVRLWDREATSLYGENDKEVLYVSTGNSKYDGIVVTHPALNDYQFVVSDYQNGPVVAKTVYDLNTRSYNVSTRSWSACVVLGGYFTSKNLIKVKERFEFTRNISPILSIANIASSTNIEYSYHGAFGTNWSIGEGNSTTSTTGDSIQIQFQNAPSTINGAELEYTYMRTGTWWVIDGKYSVLTGSVDFRLVCPIKNTAYLPILEFTGADSPSSDLRWSNYRIEC